MGTPLYIAPEVLSGKYNELCDIWSLGIVFSFMMTKTRFFDGNNLNVLLDNIHKNPVNFYGILK